MRRAADVAIERIVTAETEQSVSPSRDSLPHPSLANNLASSSAIDGLKFRMVSRRNKHYFGEVRFNGVAMLNPETAALVKFLEGRCLESLDDNAIRGQFGHSHFLHGLLTMVAELKQVLCE